MREKIVYDILPSINGASLLNHSILVAGMLPVTAHFRRKKPPASFVTFLSSFTNLKVFSFLDSANGVCLVSEAIGNIDEVDSEDLVASKFSLLEFDDISPQTCCSRIPIAIHQIAHLPRRHILKVLYRIMVILNLSSPTYICKSSCRNFTGYTTF